MRQDATGMASAHAGGAASPLAERRITLRVCEAGDLPALAALFTDAVHVLGAPHYNAAQLRAWAPRPPDLSGWEHKLAGLHVWLAQVDGTLAGFTAFDDAGHIEFLFTAPALARQGVATHLYQQVRRSVGARELSTEASLVALPFFLREGFVVVQEQQVMRAGVLLRRFAMRHSPPEAACNNPPVDGLPQR